MDDHITHYHGGPLWPGSTEMISALYRDTGAMVSFARHEQLKKIVRVSGSVFLDNGAFSVWRKSKKTNDVVDWSAYWTDYYCFVLRWIGAIDYFIVPDVIEGDECENDLLISQIPCAIKEKAVPVWHSNESLGKLVRLSEQFDLVAVGCCGEAKAVRSVKWKKRMMEAFTEIYIKRNLLVKIHGLRMLDGRALCQFPFYSADSTNVAINVPKTKVRLPSVTCKLQRTSIMRNTIEMVIPPTVDEWVLNNDT